MMAVRKAPQECAPGMSVPSIYVPAPAFVYILYVSPCACPRMSVPVCLLLFMSLTRINYNLEQHSLCTRLLLLHYCSLLLYSLIPPPRNPVADPFPRPFLFLFISLLPPLLCVVRRFHMYGVPPRSPSTAPHGRHTGEKVRTYVPPVMSCHIMSCHVM